MSELGAPDLPLWFVDRAHWRDRAACRGMSVDLFFDPATEDEALAICGECSVTDACLEAELEAAPRQTGQYGVLGGLTPDQRSDLIRERNAA